MLELCRSARIRRRRLHVCRTCPQRRPRRKHPHQRATWTATTCSRLWKGWIHCAWWPPTHRPRPEALAAAYGQPAAPGEHGRLFGRGASWRSIGSKTSSDDAAHKQQARALLKKLPRLDPELKPVLARRPAGRARACPEEARPSRVFGSGILEPARPTTCDLHACAAGGVDARRQRTRRRRAGAAPPSPRWRRRPDRASTSSVVAASAYTRTRGSVPEGRIMTHASPSSRNFTPSRRSTPTTRLPQMDSASYAGTVSPRKRSIWPSVTVSPRRANCKRPIFAEHVVHQLSQAHAALRHGLGQQQRHQQPVALHHMTRQADAARLLAAQKHAALLHLPVDPETHRSAHQLKTQTAAHALEHGRGGDRAEHTRPSMTWSSTRCCTSSVMMRCGFTKLPCSSTSPVHAGVAIVDRTPHRSPSFGTFARQRSTQGTIGPRVQPVERGSAAR